MRREFLYSLMSLAIFSGVGVLTFVLYRMGWVQLYRDIHARGWGYFAFSVGALIFLHDTWFYWTHRFMHLKSVFPLVHRVHHLSRTPTPWAAFAFHPVEAFVQAVFFPLIVLVLPVHPLAGLAWLLYMTGMNVLGHCGHEVLPRGLATHWLGKWHNTTTHHDMHHRLVRCNFGLYFNLWDRLLRTNHADYEREFDRVKGGVLEPGATPASSGHR